MRPVCGCGTEMHCTKTGAHVVTHTWDEVGDRGPYQIWMGDMFACDRCHNETVTGYGIGPVAECFNDGFSDFLKRLEADPKEVVIHVRRCES